MLSMGAKDGHLYTVEVRPSRHDPGRFTWAIHDRGKLVRGSYRPHESACAARAAALAEFERLTGPHAPSGSARSDPLDPGAMS